MQRGAKGLRGSPVGKHWSMVSNAADKSNNTNNVSFPLSILNMTSLYTHNNAVSVLWWSL